MYTLKPFKIQLLSIASRIVRAHLLPRESGRALFRLHLLAALSFLKIVAVRARAFGHTRHRGRSAAAAVGVAA